MKWDINISHLTGGLKDIKKKHFGANEDPFIGPWNESGCKCGSGKEEDGVCGGGRRRTWDDVLPWCSSLPSHGIEMETVGFLPLLSVICFLSNTQKHTVSFIYHHNKCVCVCVCQCVCVCFVKKSSTLIKGTQNKNYDVENGHMNSNAALLNNLHCSLWLVEQHPLSFPTKWCYVS